MRNASPGPLDQPIGEGDGESASFQLIKRYGADFSPYAREITRPVVGSARVAVAGAEKIAGTDFDLDATTGIVTFLPGKVPAPGAAITAGFAFDVPVRFDTDFLEIDMSAFEAGAIPAIPLVEIRG